MVILKEMNYIVLRSRGRTALSVCIAALLVCCMSFYLGSIQTAESAEKNLAQVIPVTAQVVSRSGARTVGFEIDENHFANLMKADIKDAVYTASACANFQEQYRAEDVQGADTSVTAVSGLSALVGVTEESIAFENGYDLSFLERAEPLCVVSQSYAAQYGLNSGDTLSMPFYVTRYNDDGFSLRYEHLGMQGVKIIGVYADSASGSSVPCSMIVSVPWLQTVVKDNNLRFYYSSFRCALRDPMKLNDFKDAMRGAGFAKPDPNALDERHGDTLVVDDQLFIETAEKLEQNLKVLRWFLAPFFALVIVLVTLVTFLAAQHAAGHGDLAFAWAAEDFKRVCVLFRYAHRKCVRLRGGGAHIALHGGACARADSDDLRAVPCVLVRGRFAGAYFAPAV